MTVLSRYIQLYHPSILSVLRYQLQVFSCLSSQLLLVNVFMRGRLEFRSYVLEESFKKMEL